MRTSRWLVFAVGFGCGPQPVLETAPPASVGCQPPAATTFTQVGLTIGVAQSAFSKTAAGEVNVKTDPQVVNLASQAATDDKIRQYLRCLAIKRDGFTTDQVQWLETMYVYAQSKPSAADFDRFMRWSPPPKASEVNANLPPPEGGGWILLGSYDLSLHGYNRGPFFMVIKSNYPKSSPFPREGDWIMITEDRNVVIADYKNSGLLHQYTSPRSVVGRLTDADYTGVKILRNTVLEVRAVDARMGSDLERETGMDSMTTPGVVWARVVKP